LESFAGGTKSFVYNDYRGTMNATRQNEYFVTIQSGELIWRDSRSGNEDHRIARAFAAGRFWRPAEPGAGRAEGDWQASCAMAPVPERSTYQIGVKRF
jgi:hypothetical protein